MFYLFYLFSFSLWYWRAGECRRRTCVSFGMTTTPPLRHMTLRRMSDTSWWGKQLHSFNPDSIHLCVTDCLSVLCLFFAITVIITARTQCESINYFVYFSCYKLWRHCKARDIWKWEWKNLLSYLAKEMTMAKTMQPWFGWETLCWYYISCVYGEKSLML